MSSSHKLARLAARMDALYEFDREPVAASELKPGRYFAGLFAGEHVAATEFVIGVFSFFMASSSAICCSAFSSGTSLPSCRGRSCARPSRPTPG